MQAFCVQNAPKFNWMFINELLRVSIITHTCNWNLGDFCTLHCFQQKSTVTDKNLMGFIKIILVFRTGDVYTLYTTETLL